VKRVAIGLPRLLKRVHRLAVQRRVRFTLKARQELAALGAGLDEQDACDVLAGLGVADFAGRLASEGTGEWMYVFKPLIAGTPVYLKLVLREGCLIVSFHEDEGDPDEEVL
jgi:hypothetical protein